MKRLLALFDQLIAPKGLKCLCCEERSEGESLCTDCRKALHAMRLPPWEAVNGDVYCAYRYDGVPRQLVLGLKYEGLADAAAVLAEGMNDLLPVMNLPADTVLTWVTMPERRRRQRAIDHGYELCKALSERSGLPMKKLLVRRGRARTQRGLNREKRLRNLAGAFRCDVPLNGPVLLVDDVMTTGSTAAVCTEALLMAGAGRVYVITATKATLADMKFDIRKVDRYGLYTP